MNVALHRGLGLTGALILLHAGYSAFESLSYAKSINPASPLEIPLDIRLETLLSVFLLCIAVIMSSAEFKPVKWREWTNLHEKEKPNALNILEHRPGFIDIRARRKEYLAKSGKKSSAEGKL